MKIVQLLITIFLILLISACSNNNLYSDNKVTSTIDIDLIKEIGQEKAQEMAFEWFKNNHYAYKASEEEKYSFRFTENTEVIYGKKCYLLVMYYEGKQYLFFAISTESGELYLDYDVNLFLRLNNLKILNPGYYKKDAKSIMNEVFDKKTVDRLAYFDTVEKDGVKYYVYGEFVSSILNSVLAVKIETAEVYQWDIPGNTLSKIYE